MPFTHNYGAQNIEGSINFFLKQNLGTNVPSWLSWGYGTVPPRSLNFFWPDVPLNFPSFSVTHIGNEELMSFGGDRADGTNRGIWRIGLFEVNCWVLSTNNLSWPQQLQNMRDMIFKLFQQNRYIQLYDVSTPATPTLLNALTRVEKITEMPPPEDPDPGVKRRRIHVRHSWIERF